MSDRLHTLSGYLYEYQKSVAQPEEFWSRVADSFHWKKRWSKTLKWNFRDPDVKWFINGKLNITENIFERHLYTIGDRPAIIWEPNDPKEAGRTLTYKELYHAVCQFSNALKAKGIGKGDRVIIYMPMVPEAAVAMLACARIGAIHSVVFAGFSASALADRVNDCQAKAILTADGNFRGNKKIPVKDVVDEALEKSSVETVIVYQRTHQEINMKSGRDHWWHDVIKEEKEENKAEEMDSEDMLFILYTSGSTGKPKGVVHTTGGYMVYTKYSFENVFQYSPGDIYWCTADIGWITGHSYIVYGPLLAGATTLMFEGVPTFPDAGRFWAVVEKHQVNQFYTAPTAIRALQAHGTEPIEGYDLSSLKVLGSVGEPINEEAWHWYHTHIGKGKCPIVDTWWQTETGGIMVSPLAGITPTKPAYATLPLPGIQLCIVDAEGNELTGNGVEGNLCIKFPWPSMIRTTYGDHDRCKQTYFSTYKDMYFTGDGVKRDHDGYYRILGRVDDVINVSGHRMGTAEVENAINEHPLVIESAVVGYPHEVKGQGIYAYVICDMKNRTEENLVNEIKDTVSKIIGPIAKPDKIQIVPGLPKTRSGKIMRRILRKVAENNLDNMGDTSTLLDPEVVTQIIEGRK
ncbi:MULTISPECIES: acetate--CoA ligase [unclassified Algoriphagus]|uniref:acetate--CoA ligase n=2 Tax=Algoriphagus TaxID=246875 RepID=UPI000C661396|nr:MULTISPECIES: acetate--CoA ligase [unclassified Algoriphagus]MAL15406.1 acetate--CoA ligase [Algoriphagus sp.]MAN86799.1 acetate--CoA ligase [Algoriphagus sp.]HCB44992.1 acetate--CoA ligase [Algoriphagus sp.]HCH44647.1 acetate--CoA ligase [Algoriphagus sp.]|tara:strand:+ start:1311 stop:3203 length:1893 start_codon:yes stop_codon:yes gene_type:complete